MTQIPMMGNLRPGRFARLQPEERCLHCKKVPIMGALVCQFHGGGHQAVINARKVLSNPKIGWRRKAQAASRLSKAERNKARQHLREGGSLHQAVYAEAAEVMGEVRTLIREERISRDYLNRAHKVAAELRPYRPAHALLAASLLARAVGMGQRWRAMIDFSSTLSLNADERDRTALALGLLGA